MMWCRLRYPTRCSDCGAPLPVGSPVRLYRSRERWLAYGLRCHDRQGRVLQAPAEPLRVELELGLELDLEGVRS